jgi:hypothetical protein
MLPRAALDDQRLAAHGTKRTNRTIYAADENFLGLGENLA